MAQKTYAQKTFTVSENEIEREWWIVDAEGQNLGRLASHIAAILRGKHKPTFTPHLDTGDYVVVINCKKIAVTGNKLTDKVYYRHLQYPGGLKQATLQERLNKFPERVLEDAVRGMLPKNALGRQLFRKLKVHAGPNHPHEAQQPKPLEL